MKKIIFISLIVLITLPLAGQENYFAQIFYDVDKYELTEKHIDLLKDLLHMLDENKEFSYKINAHTDSSGSEKYNYGLAEKRANELLNWLIENNIGKETVSIKNSGETDPLDIHNSYLNRRVDIVIIEHVKETDVETDPVLEKYELSEIYDSISVDEQHFNVSNQRDTMIKGNNGTIVYLPEDIFVTSSDAEIEITLKEVYDRSEMIIENLTTTSDYEQLETGGMIYLEARQNGKLLHTDRSKSLLLMFPAEDMKDGMQLFTGKFEDESPINWRTNNYSYSSVLRGSDFTLEKISRFRLFLMKLFNRKEYLSRIDREFRISDFESKYGKRKAIKKASYDDISYYVFNSQDLGWINCDRFVYSEPEKLMTYKINEKPRKNTDIKIVFKNLNSIVPAVRTSDGYVLNNALCDEDIWIVALKFKNGTPYLALKETKIDHNNDQDLEFVAYNSLQELKKDLEQLNN